MVALLAGQTVANLYLPNLNADIINNGVIKGNLGYIWTTGGLMLGITLALGVVSIVAVYFASRVAMGAGADIRAAVFDAVQAFSAREMHRFGTPSLITRNTNDIQQVQVFVQAGLTLIVIAPIMSVGGVIMAVHESAALSPLLAVSVPVMLALIGVVLVAVVPQFRSMQGKIDRINEVLREQITGVRVIRAFVRTDAEAERFGDANADLTATALRINRIFALAFPSVMAIMNLSSVAVIWFGGLLVEGRVDADRQPDRVSRLHPADPDVGDDGRVPDDPAPARGRERRADRAGAGGGAVGRRPAAAGPAAAVDGSGRVPGRELRLSGQRAARPARSRRSRSCRAGRARSSAAPAAARRRCST